jgi:hypothetical protein
MRGVPRGANPSPRALSAQSRAGTSELERAREHYRAPYDPTTGSYEFAVYKAAEVKTRLEDLFYGKCAYCETPYAPTAPVDVEHYRPKGAVEGDDAHPGYWWLAMVWENLLPSCIDCNRRRKQVTPTGDPSLAVLDEQSRTLSGSRVLQSGKKDAFPITGTRATGEGADLTAEGPLLLNPCEDDPDVHLAYYLRAANPVALLLPKHDPEAGTVSVRASTSIQVYGLNRLGLVQERTRILRQLQFLEVLIIELAKLAEDLAAGATGPAVPAAIRSLEFLQDQLLSEMRKMAAPTAPYSAMVRAWTREFATRASLGAG